MPIGVQAHAVAREPLTLASGGAHPFLALPHVLALVAVGIWAAELLPSALWVLPLSFLLSELAGGVAWLVGFPIPEVGVGTAVSVIVLGSMILAERRPPTGLAVTMVAFFALFHAQPHAIIAEPDLGALLYLGGFLAGSAVLLLGGIAIGLNFHSSKGRSWLRLSGTVILLGGVYCLVEALR